MGRSIEPLTDVQVKRAKCGDKLAKLFDGEGLYLELHPNGAKLWRFRYKRSNNKEQLISFGTYPDISLADALAVIGVRCAQGGCTVDVSSTHPPMVAFGFCRAGIGDTVMADGAAERFARLATGQLRRDWHVLVPIGGARWTLVLDLACKPWIGDLNEPPGRSGAGVLTAPAGGPHARSARPRGGPATSAASGAP